MTGMTGSVAIEGCSAAQLVSLADPCGCGVLAVRYHGSGQNLGPSCS